jgi:hypothetical protein
MPEIEMIDKKLAAKSAIDLFDSADNTVKLLIISMAVSLLMVAFIGKPAIAIMGGIVILALFFREKTIKERNRIADKYVVAPQAFAIEKFVAKMQKSD